MSVGLTIPSIPIPLEVSQKIIPPLANSALHCPGYLPLGATIKDWSGNGNDGTINGATWTRSNKGLWYLSYDGNDYVGFGDVCKVTTESFALMTWINVPAIAGVEVLIQKENELAVTADAGYAFYLRTSNPYLQLLVTDGTTAVTASACATNPADSTWHFCSGNFNSATDVVEVFIDGVSQGTGTAGAAMGSIDNTENLEFGRDYNDNTPLQYYLVGSLCLNRIQIGGTLLTAAQYLSIYNRERHLFNV